MVKSTLTIREEKCFNRAKNIAFISYLYLFYIYALRHDLKAFSPIPQPLNFK